MKSLFFVKKSFLFGFANPWSLKKSFFFKIEILDPYFEKNPYFPKEILVLYKNPWFFEGKFIQNLLKTGQFWGNFCLYSKKLKARRSNFPKWLNLDQRDSSVFSLRVTFFDWKNVLNLYTYKSLIFMRIKPLKILEHPWNP